MADEKHQVVTDLEPYLGAMAHFVIVSENTQDFLHAHPVGGIKTGSSVISTITNFPRAGIYKLWAQFQRQGQIVTVPYVLSVSAPEEQKNVAGSATGNTIEIKVNPEGYVPDRINLKAGQPARLVFVRENEENCGETLLIPSMNIKRDLPVGRTTVELTPQSGETTFSCGMNMYKGTIVSN
jgi:hypothetical protein